MKIKKKRASWGKSRHYFTHAWQGKEKKKLSARSETPGKQKVFVVI
jgi:hypothetical protein